MSMKILVSTLKGDGVWFAWLLANNGHKVDWTYYKEGAEALSGLVPAPKAKVNPSNYDLVVFDSTDMGEIADKISMQGTPTIGDSRFADLLEDDRLFGIECMEEAGIRVPTWEAFDNPGKAIDWLRKTHKRCVLKPNDDVSKDLTYVSKNEADMVAFIEKVLPGSGVKQFVLQEFVAGTEVSTEAWWTGSEWCAINYTLEEKKQMSGGLGPNTGSAGNVLWMPPKPTPLFEQGLAKIAPILVKAGYRGMIDLNTIVTEGEAYGLEWTPRFGYDSTCCFLKLLPIEFGEFLYAIATGSTPPNLEAKVRFAAAIRCSVPPYPNKIVCKKMEAHQPIDGLLQQGLEDFYVFDIHKIGEELFVCGEGNIGTPIRCGDTIGSAFDQVKASLKKLEVANLQYRNDVDKCVITRYNTLQQWGWLKQIG